MYRSRWRNCRMMEKNLTDYSPVGRRIRLSTREIALSVMLTVAALAAVVAAYLGNGDEEAALSRPMVSEVPRP